MAVTFSGVENFTISTGAETTRSRGRRRQRYLDRRRYDTITVGNGRNVIDGGAGDDSITAGSGVDTIFGGGGNDIIVAGDGGNTIDAGDGNDNITTGVGERHHRHGARQ